MSPELLLKMLMEANTRIKKGGNMTPLAKKTPKDTLSVRVRPITRTWYHETFISVGAGTHFVCESFPYLFQRTLIELKGRFNKEELMLILDVYNGSELNPGTPALLTKVEDGITLNGLDKKNNVDRASILRKIKELTSFQQTCMEVWANAYWYGNRQQTQPGFPGGEMAAYIRNFLQT